MELMQYKKLEELIQNLKNLYILTLFHPKFFSLYFRM